MTKQEQIDKTREKNSKQWQRIDKYCLRIQKAIQYKCDCDHEDVPSILVDYEREIKRELILENAVVLTKEECEHKVILDEDHFERALNYEREKARKDTAKEILTYLWKQRNVIGQLMIFEEDIIVLAKQYGVEVEE